MDHLGNHFWGILLIVLGIGSILFGGGTVRTGGSSFRVGGVEFEASEEREMSRGESVFYGLAVFGFGIYIAFF